jgi:hypothetical protein
MSRGLGVFVGLLGLFKVMGWELGTRSWVMVG